TSTGGRYHPSSLGGAWNPTSTSGAPSARHEHTAVWTGTEMIVWGGQGFSSGSIWLYTGYRYNPSTDTWTSTTTSGAPSGRSVHTAVWAGTQMIVWGGWSGSASYFNTGGRYNPSTNTWTPTATTGAPSRRYGHTAVWTGTQMIVWGGWNGSSALNTGGLYTP
ncbi:kelch repeat-containing protein, partial [Candidatus Brocadia sinica]